MVQPCCTPGVASGSIELSAIHGPRIRSSAWHGPGTPARAANARNYGPATACCATSIRGKGRWMGNPVGNPVDKSNWSGLSIHGINMFGNCWSDFVSMIFFWMILDGLNNHPVVQHVATIICMVNGWLLSQLQLSNSTMMEAQLAWIETSPNLTLMPAWCVLALSTAGPTHFCWPRIDQLPSWCKYVNRVCYGLLWSIL